MLQQNIQSLCQRRSKRVIFRRGRRLPNQPVTPHQMRTVRLLESDAELQAAVERAREFERRGVDAGQRRVGSYDRVLGSGPDNLATVVPIAPKLEDWRPVDGLADIAAVRSAGDDV
jgi:hypothetical protein